jgi:repressor LexA
MINAGIYAGDLVIVRSQPTAEPGDVVVALLGEEATVKRLAYDGGRPYLQPENAHYAPILDEFEIIGKVVGLMRRYGGRA